jgi:S1-C subfamily serine protease
MATNDEDLMQVSADDLLAELRARAAAGQAEGAEAAPSGSALSQYDGDALYGALRSQQKVIYGVDNRVDVFIVSDQATLDDADSVVALFSSGDVVANGDGTSTLQTENFGTARNLCPTERFREQPIGAFCSGFLVAPDVIATAGHCVNDANVTDVRFVFGYRMQDATTEPSQISDGEIFSGASLIGREEEGAGADWALVRLDRPVTNHPVVDIRRSGKIADNEGVHVIGHPVGLPTKVAGGASVRDNSPAEFFVANLDTYGGNSGSPVFNSETHAVEGILVRGETDFVQLGFCRVSLVCPDTGCRGEDCTRTTEFAALVPLAGGQLPPPFPGRLLKFPPLTVGSDVAMWQQRMVERGFDLVVDGKYGPNSKAACMQFQGQQGLQVDGIVGPITWAATFAP